MRAETSNTVGKLTPRKIGRRHFDALWLVALLLCAAKLPAQTANWHPVDDIATTAEQFLGQRVGESTNTTVRGMVDTRLRLGACDRALEGFMRAGTRVSAKTIVGVRCPGSKPWKVYVPVEVVVRTQVWIASRTLPRGHLLTKEDIKPEERDVARMNQGYITEINQLLGQRMKSSVLAGRAITDQLVEADDLVSRGQTVTLAVMSGNINIRMRGKALSDGGLNERIRVENLNSGRVVEGVVRSPEVVEVLVSQTGNFFSAKP